MPDSPAFICKTVIFDEGPQIIATAKGQPGQTYQLPALVSALLDKGRVLLLGAAVYLRTPMLQNKDVQKLLNNTIAWGAGTRRPKVQVWSRERGLERYLSAKKNITLLKDTNTISVKTNVLFLTYDISDTVKQKQLERFIRSGGTLIFGSPLSDNQIKFPNQGLWLSLNPLFQKMGIFQITDPDVLHAYRGFLNTGKAPLYLSIDGIIESIKANNYPREGKHYYENNAFFYNLYIATGVNPEDAPVIKRLKKVIHFNRDSLIVPTPANHVSQNLFGNYLNYYVQQLLINKQLNAKPEPDYIAPASKTFPGEVPKSAERISEQIVIYPRTGRQGLWEPEPDYSRPYRTGLYVPAGERITVSLDAKDAVRHIQARIGVHNDDVSKHDEIVREAFDLTRTFDLKNKKNIIYSPYGGILTINVSDTTTLKTVSIQVDGAVKYPYFKLGKTDTTDWQKNIRNYDAPWAELASDKIILIVPSARIRDLNDPARVLRFWDDVLNKDAILANIDSNRAQPERVIVDPQPAAGYMFTVPEKIIVPNDNSCELMLNVDSLMKKGSWGLFHELGHRHQFWALDFDGLTEVTVNLYTMYVYDKLLHKGIYNHEDMMSRKEVADKVNGYLAGKPSFAKWKQDPFLALSMYIQLIDAFGWQPIEQVFKTYRTLPRDKYPTTDEAKRDYWFKCICAATQKNLSAFFDKWKVPVSNEAKSMVKNYPEWLPAEMQ